jgi:hypothetical protein
MANFVFGDVDEIVCQHTLGEFRFAPKANESGTRDKGGIRANDDASQITSNGQNMTQLNRVKWSFEVTVAISSDGQTEEDLSNLSKHPDDGTWTISYLNGLVSKGKGRPVGDLQSDSNAGTMTLKLSGGGELEKI